MNSYKTPANTAPTNPPTKYTWASLNLKLNSAGPKYLKGFAAPPVITPPITWAIP